MNIIVIRILKTFFSWEPYEYQWWITGFNPKYVDKVDVRKYVMVGSVNFAKQDEMYIALKKETLKYPDYAKFVIFDDKQKTVWINWYEENLV